ncbi:hypothetical protein NEFER03_1565 [Nematocida sp. LUAm3]|nr:hypothetical protein NEFER03_1565 [Nematocida sp. LUAm3]KAI5174598.1 hypothetical protein NEFER02_0719 [Nematocida sp. LUAm2]KAI5177996.1 hypothetical protein NEFER01_1178 [Nematocida sp. LUAm1]
MKENRRALGEKMRIILVPVRRCCFCGNRIISENEGVSTVKDNLIGFKYVGDKEYMAIKDILCSNKVPLVSVCSLETDEDNNICSCLSPNGYFSPIGTKFLRNELFTCSFPFLLFSPKFIEYTEYVVCSERIIREEDLRSTCMIKNIPNKLTVKQLVVILSSIYYNAFDFLYLRMDFKSNCNNGYAFINFRNPKYIPIFLEAIKGKKWRNFNSEKRGDITYARIQGMAQLQNRFKRSDILSASKEYWPIVFNEKGEEIAANRW